MRWRIPNQKLASGQLPATLRDFLDQERNVFARGRLNDAAANLGEQHVDNPSVEFGSRQTEPVARTAHQFERFGVLVADRALLLPLDRGTRLQNS